MQKTGTLSAILFLGAAPRVLFARDLKSILGIFVDLLNLSINLMMVLALLGFIYGAIKFIYSAGDERARDAGKKTMVWGILALFFMVAVWGMVKVLKQTFFG